MKLLFKKRFAVGVILLALALLGVVVAQQWVSLVLHAGAASAETLSVTGAQANAAMTPVLLAALVCVFVFAISRGAINYLLLLLLLLAGVAVSFFSAQVIADPLAAAHSAVVSSTAITVADNAVRSSGVTAMPYIAAGAGCVIALVALLQAVFGRFSAAVAAQSREDRYSRAADKRGAQPAVTDTDRVSEWDQLSGGSDPSLR